MTETLLKYINNTLKLPYQIKNIEREFKNGFFFGELLEKSEIFKGKIKKYNENPRAISEIKENFKFLQKDLHLIEIYINNSTINDLMIGKKGVAPKLIYKIKTELDRIKINFNNIIEKINDNSFREKYELGKKKNFRNFNKAHFLELTQSDKFPMSPSVTTRETLSTFTNFFLRTKNINHNHVLLSEDKKINSSDIKFINLKNKIKLRPININIENEKGKLFKSSKTTLGMGSFPDLLNANNMNYEENIEEKINYKNNNNILVSTSEIISSNKKERKNKYRTLYNKKNEKIKINASSYNRNKIPNEKYIQYSIFDNEIKKLGININEIAPKLQKSGINYNNDFYLEPKQIVDNLKNVLALRKEENKNKLGKINLIENKNNLLISKEKLLKNSIINQYNEEDKLFSIKLKKDTSKYKINEYDKLLKSKNIHNKINKKYYIKDFYFRKIFNETKTKYFDFDEYINGLDNERSFDKSNKKSEKKLANYQNIKSTTNLIIDFVEQCYKCQIKLEEELIELPEYREWTEYFIEGKSCLKIPIKKRRDKNDNSKNEKESCTITNNSSILTKLTKRSDKKKEQKKFVDNHELIMMEYEDYLFYRGNWEISNFVNKNSYGKYLQIYNILEDDIFKIIPSVNHLFHGLKQSILLNKNNNEFELNEDELKNIFVPKSNVRNTLFGEMILLNFDNASNSIMNNSIINLPNRNNNKIKNYNKNNTIEKKNENFEEEYLINYQEEALLKNNYYDFSYIPVKICLIGHPYSGRKTQAKLLCEKYKNLKSYSINDITKFYFDEYNRLHTPIEKNPKFKSLKKNQITQIKEKMEEELKNYNDIFILIEKSFNKNKEKVFSFDIDKISDELKINLFIYQIKKDFRKKNENEINEEIQAKIQTKQKLEEEINMLKEEIEKEASSNNNKEARETKKSKPKQKKNNNDKNIKNLSDELEKIINDSFEGFILYDYPNTYNQFVKLENIAAGFIQAIDQEPNKRDIFINILTNTIDKPYINISNVNKEAESHLNQNNLNQKSFFNSYILLELSEEETLKRMNNRLKDPNTGIIYHREYSPPNTTDKKLNDRLVEVTEPSDEKIKELINQFYLEYPNILYFIHLFNNLHTINLENKEEIFK